GRVQALRIPSLHRHPAARSMGMYDDADYTEAVGYVTAVELRSLGVNMNLAPVIDLYGPGPPEGSPSPREGEPPPGPAGPTAGGSERAPDHDSGVIGDRAFDTRPDIVAELGNAYAAGLRRGGVIAVAKHFPGHGATIVDSHGALPTVSQNLAQLRGSHLRPFAAAVDAGIPAVMTAHILYPQVDKDHPVTLSGRWLQGILREDLAFRGVIVSDAVEMRALTANYSLKEILLLGLRAGIDLFLITDWIDPVEAVDTVVALVEHGLVSKERIREGARRVLELKNSYGLLEGG
ncbi:MAG: glycoside hydrolase family 3 N-terminal domain-containing protein, partial [Spirochaetota bacterium]